jgi:tetratricopeptide (TPR) repeat protein
MFVQRTLTDPHSPAILACGGDDWLRPDAYLTSMRRLLLLLLCLPSVALAQPLPALEAEAYERCMAQARAEPSAGWETALQWQSRGGRHPAEHCAAVALIGLGQYGEAGRRLEKLADEMRRAPPELLGEVLGQAGQAWLLAGDAARAHAALTEAIAILPNSPDLFVDRATAAAAGGDYPKAEADCDRALALDARRADALTYRASARRALGKTDAALADVEAALKLEPNSPDALLERGNLLSLKGDLGGARRDWVRVSLLAPDTPADVAAKANIERLELKPEPSAAPAPTTKAQTKRR